MTMSFIIVATVLATAILYSQDVAERKTLSLQIKGMTCNGCASLVENSLKKVEGVLSLEINLEKGLGVVQFVPTKVKEEAIISAVEKAGGKGHSFKAEKVTDTKQGTNGEKDLPACCNPSREN